MSSEVPLLVTGGCGFIGADFVLQWLRHKAGPVVNLDALTCAGNPQDVSAEARDLEPQDYLRRVAQEKVF